jgi:hypothetical protein
LLLEAAAKIDSEALATIGSNLSGVPCYQFHEQNLFGIVEHPL